MVVEMSESEYAALLEVLSPPASVTIWNRIEYESTRVPSSRLMAPPHGYTGLEREHSGILLVRGFFFFLPSFVSFVFFLLLLSIGY
jgi:hypothetical protein